MASRDRIIREGSLAAQREIARLRIDETRRVEIFEIIEDEGIWLMFQPLDRLYGFYERIGDAAGIAIHAGHPWGLQRFTAAHEYGHHVLRHEGSLDTAEEIESRSTDARELAAQAFAATFLMPVQLVNVVLQRLGLPLRPRTMSAEHVYEASLELGSSYTAALTQLRALGKIDWQTAQRLAKRSPIEIKEALGGGERPQNARADVWLLEEDDHDRDLVIRLEDEIDVRLPEVPTSGYRWLARVDRTDSGPSVASNDLPLVEVRSRLEPVDARKPRRYGGERRRRLRLRAVRSGDVDLELVLVQPWLGADAEPLRRLRAHVRVAEPRTGGAPQGVSIVQQEALLAA